MLIFESVIFEMKYIFPVDEDEQAMTRIVLEENEREMLMGMIGNNTEEPWNVEFIEGKGRGQVILLYGTRFPRQIVSKCLITYRPSGNGKDLHCWYGLLHKVVSPALTRNRMRCKAHPAAVTITDGCGSRNRRKYDGGKAGKVVGSSYVMEWNNLN